MSYDWTKDPRPFSECLVAWTKTHNVTREEAANQLRIPMRSYRAWTTEGVTCRHERSLRLLMSLIDYVNERTVKPEEIK